MKISFESKLSKLDDLLSFLSFEDKDLALSSFLYDGLLSYLKYRLNEFSLNEEDFHEIS